MLKRCLLLIPLLFALLIVGVSAADDPTVETNDAPELGTYLMDADGMSLYIYTEDEAGSGKSVCNDTCAENWPPFTADDPLTLPDGVPGKLSQITRDDRSKQVAYNGQPLYYFAKDEKPAETRGHEVGDVWFVVSPGNQGGTPAASPVASPIATPSG